MVAGLLRRSVAVILASLLAALLPTRATVAQSSVSGQWSGPYKLPSGGSACSHTARRES